MPRLVYFLLMMFSLTACASPTPLAVQAQPSTPTSVTVVAFTTTTPLSITQTPAPTVSIPTATATKVMRPPSTPLGQLTSTPQPAQPITYTTTLTPTPTVTIKSVVYLVKPGDTFYSIALSFDVAIKTLIEANNIQDETLLQIGQELIIPLTEEMSPAPVASIVKATTMPNAVANVPTVAPTSPPPTLIPSGPPIPSISHQKNINPLTGLPINDPTKLQRRPILVRIGNDVGARPAQVGLNQADMVYEEIVEWWLTRFTAIFWTEAPTLVAPIRSARLMNVQLAPQYQGALAHSGGSDQVRWEIAQSALINLDQFYVPSPYYFRPNENWQTRATMNVAEAHRYLVSKGLEAAVSLPGFLFNDTIANGEVGETLYIPYPTSFTKWHYDAGRGKYLRWVSDKPLVDAGDGTQVAAANVIVYFAEHQKTTIVEDSTGATSVRIIINGRGTAWFFRDGKLNKGFWQTDGTRTPYFSTENGTAYPLKPGNTWVEVVPTYFTIGLKSPDEAKANP